jgi:hypothetical protein
MKKVFNKSSDVIHLFAQRTQSEAKCGNCFFDNPNKIYSYGHHYLLGEFITNEAGQLAIMINDRGYSVTTSKHISEIRSATRQYRQFYTTYCEPYQVLQKLENLINAFQKAKKPEMYIQKAEGLYHSFCEYLQWKGEHITDFLEINAAIEVFRTKDVKTYLAEKAEVLKASELKKKKEQAKRVKKALKDFFEYKADMVYNSDEDFCRLSQDGAFVQTSQRINIPVKQAAILYKMIVEKKDIKGFQLQGQYSTYTVIGLNGVLKIGCHKINKKNMSKIGAALLATSK